MRFLAVDVTSRPSRPSLVRYAVAVVRPNSPHAAKLSQTRRAFRPMSPKAKNYVIAFLLCTTLGGAALLVQTRQQLAAARLAPTLQVTRSEFTTAAAPAPLIAPTPAPAPAPDESPNFDVLRDGLEGFPGGGGPGGGGGGNRGQRGGAQFAAQMAELMKDPEFVSAWKLEQEARVEQRYGALFKTLNLPPDRLASLKTLLAERANAGRDVWTSAREQGLNPRDPAARDQLRQLTADLQAEIDASIKNAVGPAVMTAIEGYNATSTQRTTVNTFDQKLSSLPGAQSLNPSQSQQLTTILAETGRQQDRSTLITDATITRAAGVLTNSQLTTLKQLQAEQQAQQVLQTKMRAARDAARAARE